MTHPCSSTDRPSAARRRAEHGFTLLEVMVSFAILAGLTSITSLLWSKNMQKAQRAVTRRELREVADSCFRRILYEITKHEDGMTRNVADFYARDWLKLEGREAEKYSVYSLRLDKKVKSAAGNSDDDDAESLFGEANDNGTSGGSGTSGSGSSGETEEEEGEGGPAITLLEVTLTLFYSDDAEQGQLVTLKTYIREPAGGDSG